MKQYPTPEEIDLMRKKYNQIIQEEESNKERNAYEYLLKKMNEQDQKLIEQSKDSLKPVTIDIKEEDLDSFLKNIENI